MPVDSNGWGRPGHDARDKDLDNREKQAIRNENSGSTTRRQEVVTRRAGADVVKGR